MGWWRGKVWWFLTRSINLLIEPKLQHERAGGGGIGGGWGKGFAEVAIEEAARRWRNPLEIGTHPLTRNRSLQSRLFQLWFQGFQFWFQTLVNIERKSEKVVKGIAPFEFWSMGAENFWIWILKHAYREGVQGNLSAIRVKCICDPCEMVQ